MKWTHSAVVLLLCHVGAQAGEMNDTGIRTDQWARVEAPYVFGTNDFTALNYFQIYAPRQDAQFGRAAADAAGALIKIGGGAAGFDFTRLCGNGDEEGAGTCPSGLTAEDIGSGSTDWACTRDNVTGWTWELKTDDGGLRDQDWTYSWYNTDAGSNGGVAGTQTPESNPTECGGHLANCNTEEYAAAINALNEGAGLCGFADWRVPSFKELNSVVNYGEVPAGAPQDSILLADHDYFPYFLGFGTVNQYWTSTVVAQDPEMAHGMPMTIHRSHLIPKSSTYWLFLVHGDE